MSNRKDDDVPVFITAQPDRTTMAGLSIGLLMRRIPGTFILVSLILDVLVLIYWSTEAATWYIIITGFFITLPATIRKIMNNYRS